MMKTLLIGLIGLVLGWLGSIYVLPPGSMGGGEQAASGGEAQPEAAPVVAKVRWKMASSFPGEMIQLGTLGKRFDSQIGLLSGGTMDIKFFEPGALVPALEVFDSVSSGAIDSGWTSSGYVAGKIPALQFFAAVPFGPDLGEYLAWLYFGGGEEIYQEIYARYNVHAMHCGMISAEGSGWFREPIESLDDLKGLKMRFFGLGAKVMEKLGVSTQLLSGGDIFPALELGTIDATEFSMPAIDLDLGFYQVSKHYYFPGWHQPSSLLELIINMDRWNELDVTQKAIIESACGDSIRWGIAEGEAIQFGALQELQEKGVTLHRWSSDILDAMRAGWDEVVIEESAKDAEFKRVWDHLSAFREGYALWASYGRL